MRIDEIVKNLAKERGTSLNQLCPKVGLAPSNINNKINRGTLYFLDVEKLLSAINYHIEILPNNIKISFEKDEKTIDR